MVKISLKNGKANVSISGLGKIAEVKIKQALEFGFNEQVNLLIKWMGDKKEKEFMLNIHGRPGKIGVVKSELNIIELSKIGSDETLESLKVIFYHSIRHLLNSQESEATAQQHTVALLTTYPELLKAHAKLVASNNEGIKANSRWAYIVGQRNNLERQEFVYKISANRVAIFASIQEKFNRRMKLNWRRPPEKTELVLDGKVESELKLMLIDEHIQRLSSDIDGRDNVLIPHQNFYFNSWFVMFKDGVIHYVFDEFDQEERIYSSIVVYNNGRIAIESLKYIKGSEDAKDRIVLNETGEDLTDKVRLAFFGQQIVKDGELVNVDDIREQFADYRHLEEPFQHSIFGIDEKGDIIIMSVGGDRKNPKEALTIEQAAEFAKSKGSYNAILLSNGGDVNPRENGELMVASPAGTIGSVVSMARPWSTAAIAIVKKDEENTENRHQDNTKTGGARSNKKRAVIDIEDLDQDALVDLFIDEIIKRKKHHVHLVIAFMNAFIKGDFDALYETFDKTLGVEKDEYIGLIKSLFAKYEKLSDQAKLVLVLATIFHDCGALKGTRDWDHNVIGAGRVKNLLLEQGFDPEIGEKVSRMVDFHAFYTYLGVEFFPADFMALTEEEKEILFFISVFDGSGRISGNSLVPWKIRHLIDLRNHKIEELEKSGEFYAYRLGNRLSPYTFAQESEQAIG